MSFSRDWTRYGMWRVAGCTAIAAKPQVQSRLVSGEEFGRSCEYAPAALRFKPESAALESGLARHVAQSGAAWFASYGDRVRSTLRGGRGSANSDILKYGRWSGRIGDN